MMELEIQMNRPEDWRLTNGLIVLPPETTAFPPDDLQERLGRDHSLHAVGTDCDSAKGLSPLVCRNTFKACQETISGI